MSSLNLIKGKHAVYEALNAGAKIDRILIDFRVLHDPAVRQIQQLANQQHIKVQMLKPESFAKECADKNSQGVLAYLFLDNFMTLKQVIANPEAHPFIVILDHLQDPYNFGAILRTCETFSISTIIYPKDRACQITPGVMKVSSGAINYLNMVKVTNLVNSAEQLKAAGWWLYGADSNGGQDLAKIQPQFPLALVVGNEEKGISPLLASKLDQKVNIPLSGKVKSLNVSVATGIIAYHLFKSLK